MPEAVLTLSLRPRTLSALVGQRSLVEAVRKLVAKRLPQAWLLCGPPGTGKTSVARIFGHAYNCTHMTLWGDPCTECQQNKAFSILEINASEYSGKEDVGDIVDAARYQPQVGAYRVIILDEAQLLTRNSQNLLLKHFEDAPRTTVWIICTTEPSKILPALRRRCMDFQLKTLSFKGTEVLLARAAKKIGWTGSVEALTEELGLAQIFSPALILKAFEKFAAGTSAKDAVMGGEANVESLRICRAVVNGKWNEVKEHMSAATAEDARYIQASVCGYLRSMLLSEGNLKRRSMLADCMFELTSYSPMDNAMLMFWLWAVLHRICKRFTPL